MYQIIQISDSHIFW